MNRRWAWLALAAAFAALYPAARLPGRERVVLAALDAGEAAGLCRQAGYSPDDFWERAKTIGVAAAVARPEPLARLVERGEVLHFTAEELEKWKAVGLVAPGVALKPDSLWVRDPRVADQILEAASRAGLAVGTSAAAGYQVAQFPGRVDLALGIYDAGALAAPARRGVRAVRAGLDDSGLKTKEWDVRSGRASLLRAAYGRPDRLIVARLAPALGVDGNLELLRTALRELSERGVDLRRPFPEPWPASSARRAKAAKLLAWVLGLFGPLLGARAGLVALKRGRSVALSRWPVVSPELQLAAGMLAAGAAAAALGLAVRELGIYPLSGSPGSWALWTMVGPVVVGAATLYTIDWGAWRRRLGSPITWTQALGALAVLAVAALFFEPRFALQRAGLWSLAPRWGAGTSIGWWWPWRWREMLIGYPCLLQALFLVNWKMDCPDCEGMKKDIFNDPRGWFLLGLLGPGGAVIALGAGGVPIGMALAQTAFALLAGAALGAASLGARILVGALAHDHPSPAN